MQGSRFGRRRLRAPVAAGALALSFGIAFACGHDGGEPKVEPVRAAALTVAADLPPIPALAVSAPPALATPVRHARARKRASAGGTPPSPRVAARPRAVASPGAASPPAPAAQAPPPDRRRRRSGGGGGEQSAGAAEPSTGPAAPTPVPVQVAPAPLEPEPEEGEEPDEETAPEEAAG